jgi:integrase
MQAIQTNGLFEGSLKLLHLRHDEALCTESVSSTSQWGSHYWNLDSDTPGSKKSASSINWDIKLHDGSSLLDAQHALLLDWLRRFSWSLFVAPGDSADALKPASAGNLGWSLQIFVPWIVASEVCWPHELTASVLDDYIDDLPALIASRPSDADGDEDNSVTISAARVAITVVFRIWQQRKALAAAGVKPMQNKPWPHIDGANTLAKAIATEAIGWLKPLPDEIAVPILNKATLMLGIPAEDVLRLQEELSHAYDTPIRRMPGGGTQHGAKFRQKKAAQLFEFSVDPETGEAWHPPLSESRSENGQHRGLNRARALVTHIQAAAMLVLQAFVGLRVSELCGLKAGIDAVTGLPSCVEKRLSFTGLNEEFVLRGTLSKGEAVPQDVPWLLGMRPRGSQEIPIALKAILILQKLLEPYRELAGTNDLLVSLGSPNGLPKSSGGVHRITGGAVNNLYRVFVGEWVDLSGLPDQSEHGTEQGDLVEWRESRGMILSSHQLRKTFGLYLLSVEARLLPAVARQFHHLNTAITESGYWGTNSPQLEPVNAVAAQQTALMVYELATGKSQVVGRMGEQLTENLVGLKERFAKTPEAAHWREAVRWVRENDLLVTFGAHGNCLPLVGSKMECAKAAGKRPLGPLRPNFEFRSPSLCAGCACFLVSSRNIDFWERRYIDNERVWRDAVEQRKEGEFIRIRDRARQAKAFLSMMGGVSRSLEARVTSGRPA